MPATHHLAPLPYAAALLFPVSLYFGTQIGGLAILAPLIVYFVFGALADHIFGRGNGLDPDVVDHSPVFQAIVTIAALTHVAALAWAVTIFSGLAPFDQILFTLSFGVALSGAAICCAHELLHKASKPDRFLGQALLVLTNYGSFAIDHVFIHHNPRITATKADPSLSHVGQTSYDFVVRAAVGSAIEAYHLEQRRLKTTSLTLRNRVTRTFTFSLIVALTILVTFGPLTALFYILQGALGVWTLWMTGYLQHYGLLRATTPTGQPAALTAANCWDCDFHASNYLLFNLPRHSHHHQSPTQHYQKQRASSQAMTLPHGYPVMTMVALIPSLWFKTMNPRLKTTPRGAAASSRRTPANLAKPKRRPRQAPPITIH